MKYHVLVNGNHHEVELERHAGGYRVRHGDHVHQVELEALAEGDAYSLLVDGRSVDVGVEEKGQQVELMVSGRRYPTTVLGEREWLARSIEKDTGEGDKQVRAVMTGIVRDVLVAPGDTVEPGQVVLILEAMKMENEVKAGAGGTVSAVHCSAGDTVELGVVLVLID